MQSLKKMLQILTIPKAPDFICQKIKVLRSKLHLLETTATPNLEEQPREKRFQI